MAKANVLVIGGCGFIGSLLVRELVEKGYFVRILDNLYRGKTEKVQDLIDKKLVEFVEGDVRYFPKVIEVSKEMDFIFLKAADCINKSLKNPLESIDINIIGAMNVFECAVLHNIKKVVFASSASVYGDPEELPMREDSPLSPITPYCISKTTIENIAQYYARFHNIKYIGFRYFNVYGPGQNVDAFYTNVVILFLKRIMDNLPPIIKGDGKQSMDFINVKDIVLANILALKDNVENEIFNIGTNRSTSVSQLAEILLHAIGRKEIKAQYTGEKSIVSERRADYSKAEQILGWKPTITVEEGMAELAQDIMNHPEKY